MTFDDSFLNVTFTAGDHFDVGEIKLVRLCKNFAILYFTASVNSPFSKNTWNAVVSFDNTYGYYDCYISPIIIAPQEASADILCEARMYSNTVQVLSRNTDITISPRKSLYYNSIIRTIR